MIKKPKQNAKYLFTTLDGRHFIFFQNSYIAMLIEIFEHKNLADAKEHLSDVFKSYENSDAPVLAAMTNLDLKFYLLVATRVFHLNIKTNQAGADRLVSLVKRLADWYRYTYLLPVVKGVSPIASN